MKIKALCKFKDGTDLFEKDDIRTIDDDKALYFINMAWAMGDDGSFNQPFEGETNLSIKSGSFDLNADKNIGLE